MCSGLWITASVDTSIPQCSEREKTEVSRLLHFLKEITTVGGYDYSLNNKIFLGHLF